MKKLICILLIASGLVNAQPPPPFNSRIMAGLKLVQELMDFAESLTDQSLDSELRDFELNAPGSDLAAKFARRGNATRATSATPVVLGSLNTTFDAVYTVVAPFYDYFPTAGGAAQSNPATVQPATPPDPRMIFVDGFGAGLIAVDLASLTVVSQVAAIPMSAGPLAVRPSSSGSSNEVWVAEFSALAIADLAGQSVAANISIPSIPVAVTPAGIVFTPDGATAFEAFSYGSPDSSGNKGALVVMNATTRTVTSTLPMKIQPTAVLMAPDGSTIYILSANGIVTYYDVLSGTADLSVSTYPPGSNAGYPGAGSVVFIHPDGTRLFWSVGKFLTVFDLTTRKVTNQFDSGLSTSVSHIFSLTQDGVLALFSGRDGSVAFVDTYDGTVVATFSTGEPTSVYGGPPVAP